MATNFPASLDTLTNPTSSDSLSSPSHSAQHANVNDAVEALQAKVGADSSAVTSSLDYKVAQLEAISHGKILQVVHATQSTQVDTTSATFVSTNLTANITPSNTANKVLVFAYLPMSVYATDTRSGYAHYEIDRDGTSVTTTYNIGYVDNDGTTSRRFSSVVTFFALDSPASTSAVTYTINHLLNSALGTVQTFYSNKTGHLILMEVAA